MKVEYSSNNSGGSWWLKTEDWKALEDAGWNVEWGGLYFCHSKSDFTKCRRPRGHIDCWDGITTNEHGHNPCEGHRAYESYDEAIAVGNAAIFLGAIAIAATRHGLALHDAVEEWEKVTGKSSTDAGCPCCGQPHTFTEYDDAGKYIKSGPDAEYVASWD
jgi:hypothetical protein